MANQIEEIKQNTKDLYQLYGKLYAKITRIQEEIDILLTDYHNLQQTIQQTHVPKEKAEPALSYCPVCHQKLESTNLFGIKTVTQKNIKEPTK